MDGESAMDRLLALGEVEHITSLKKSQLYAMMKNGQFPGSLMVTARRRAWLASEIQAFIESRSSKRSCIATGNSNPTGH
jgi:prophage regulatory protein